MKVTEVNQTEFGPNYYWEIKIGKTEVALMYDLEDDDPGWDLQIFTPIDSLFTKSTMRALKLIRKLKKLWPNTETSTTIYESDGDAYFTFNPSDEQIKALFGWDKPKPKEDGL